MMSVRDKTRTQERGCERLFQGIGGECGYQKDGGREGFQRPLGHVGEGLRKKRETWPGGRAEMWPRRLAAAGNRTCWADNVAALCASWRSEP